MGKYIVSTKGHGLLAEISKPDTIFHGANMGPTWVLSAPDGPDVGPMNLAIRAVTKIKVWQSEYPHTVCPKKYAHGFCFAVLCCGYKLTDFPISIRLTSLALWQSNDCPSASKATLMIMDKYFMWIHNVRLHNHNKAKHNKTVCIFLGIYCKEWDEIYSSMALFRIISFSKSSPYWHFKKLSAISNKTVVP